MKKIFSIMAVALVAFSLASCKGHNEPDEPEQPTDTTVVPVDTTDVPTVDLTFKITVSNITASAATVALEPSKNDVDYYWTIVGAEDLKKYGADSLAAVLMLEEVEYYESTYESLVEDNYIVKGKDSYTFSTLQPETEYSVIAFPVDKELKVTGKAATENFKTAELVITETVNVSGEGELENYVDWFGMFAVTAAIDDNGAYLTFTIDADELEGNFTEADLDPDYGAWLVIDEKTNEYYSVVTLTAEGKLNAEGTEYSFKGEAACANGVKYVFDFTCPNEEIDWDSLFGGDEEYAPAKRAPKKAVNAHKGIAIRR